MFWESVPYRGSGIVFLTGGAWCLMGRFEFNEKSGNLESGFRRFLKRWSFGNCSQNFGCAFLDWVCFVSLIWGLERERGGWCLTGCFDCNEKSGKRESGCVRFGTRWSFGNWSRKELEGRHLGFCLGPELDSWCLNKPVPNEPPFVLNCGLFGKGSHQVRDCALWVMPCVKGSLN